MRIICQSLSFHYRTLFPPGNLHCSIKQRAIPNLGILILPKSQLKFESVLYFSRIIQLNSSIRHHDQVRFRRLFIFLTHLTLFWISVFNWKFNRKPTFVRVPFGDIFPLRSDLLQVLNGNSVGVLSPRMPTRQETTSTSWWWGEIIRLSK